MMVAAGDCSASFIASYKIFLEKPVPHPFVFVRSAVLLIYLPIKSPWLEVMTYAVL